MSSVPTLRLTCLALAVSSLAVIGCAPGGADPVDEDVASDDASGLGEATLHFEADYAERVEGELLAGSPIRVAYAASRLPACRGEQGGIPQWSITAHWRLDAIDGSVHEGAVAVAGLTNGEEPVIEPPEAGELTIYFQSTNRWGCTAYDSDFGADYHFDVDPPEGVPGWVGNAASVISRQTCNDGRPCDGNRVPLDQGFRFDTWARQRAAIAHVYFDVWEEGVTDRDGVEVWREVDARVNVRFDGQEAFTMRYADLYGRVGNDARFQLALRTIDPFFAMSSQVPAEACPDVVLETTPDGFYVRTSVELTFEADGVTLAPEGGAYVGVFEDYAGPYAACL